MEKSTTLNLRINPEIKENAEKVLSQLGVSMSSAVNMFLNQVILTESIPFLSHYLKRLQGSIWIQ